MLPINGIPFLHYLVWEFRRMGYRRITFLTGFQAEAIHDYFGDGEWLGCEMNYIQDSRTMGTGSALMQAIDQLPSKFVLVNGDTFAVFPHNDIFDHLRGEDADAQLLIGVCRVIEPGQFGGLEIRDGIVSSFQEKRISKSGFVNAGVYALSTTMLKKYGDSNSTSLEHHIIPRMVEDGVVRAAVCTEFIDIGTPASLDEATAFIEKKVSRPCAFLDRDGVIIRDTHYVCDPASVILMPRIREALEVLRDSGYYIVVVSNQAGIARGKISLNQLMDVSRAMRQQLFVDGLQLDAILYCPHHEDFPSNDGIGECENRKPNPGMLRTAFARFPLRKEGSFLLGDQPSDLAAAEKFGIPAALVDGMGPYTVVQEMLKRTNGRL